MSDFDREAERERLREKYERDEEKRKHSERMSELLLKGATMTNVHCDECGDPIFRYDGQEFCPTCQREVGADAADAAPAGADAPGQGADTPDESGSGPTVDADRATDAGSDVVADGIVGDPDPDADPAATPEPPATPGDEVPDPDASPGGAAGGSARPDAGRDAAAAPSTSPERGTASRPAAGDSGDGDLAEARAALVRTLADAARRAEETTDPRTRRDHLAAAREAAEALSALR